MSLIFSKFVTESEIPILESQGLKVKIISQIYPNFILVRCYASNFLTDKMVRFCKWLIGCLKN